VGRGASAPRDAGGERPRSRRNRAGGPVEDALGPAGTGTARALSRREMAGRRPILVVEHDDALRTLLSMVVRDEIGAPVVEARDGREALEQVERVRPALMLVALRMPILDGHELCRRVKADPATRGIPLVALSGGDGDGRAVSCDDYLVKPFGYDELVGKLRRWLSPPAA